MMTKKMMKRTAALALVGAMSYGAVGVSQVSASALSVPEQRASYTSFDGRNDVQQLAWGGRRKSGGKRYSQGSMTTAAIVGAVVGAIIAKNT